MGGEDGFGGDGDEVAGGLAGVGVVGEGGDGLGEDGAVEGGVGGGGVGVEDVVFGAGVELADGGVGEGHLGVEGLGVGGEDGDGEGVDVGGDVGGGAGLVVATAGEREEEDRGEEAHASCFYCRIGGWVGFCAKKRFEWRKCGFCWGFWENRGAKRGVLKVNSWWFVW